MCPTPVTCSIFCGSFAGVMAFLYYRLFLFDVRILDSMHIFQSLYHFGRVLSRAELNLFGNSIWLNESMVICLSNFVTCSKLLALLQRQVRRADSD